MKRIKALFFMLPVYSICIISGCSDYEIPVTDSFGQKRGREISINWVLKVGEGKLDNISIPEWDGLELNFTYNADEKKGTYGTKRPQSSTAITDRDKVWKESGTFEFSNPDSEDGVNIIYRDGNKTIPVGLSYSDVNGIIQLTISFTISGTSGILNTGENLRTTGVNGKWNFVFVPAAK